MSDTTERAAAVAIIAAVLIAADRVCEEMFKTRNGHGNRLPLTYADALDEGAQLCNLASIRGMQ